MIKQLNCISSTDKDFTSGATRSGGDVTTILEGRESDLRCRSCKYRSDGHPQRKLRSLLPLPRTFADVHANVPSVPLELPGASVVDDNVIVFFLVFNCWSTPLIEFVFRSSVWKTQLSCAIVIVVLDVTSYIVILLVLFEPHYK